MGLVYGTLQAELQRTHTLSMETQRQRNAVVIKFHREL